MKEKDYLTHSYLVLSTGRKFLPSGGCVSRRDTIRQWSYILTYTCVSQVLKKGPAIVVHVVVLQDQQLANISGGDVAGHF